MVNAVKSAKQTEIWITDNVQDIFYAVVTLHLLTTEGVDASGMTTRYFGGRQVRWGLGTKSPEELEVLFSTSTVDLIDSKLYRAAWKAIAKGSGGSIKSFIDEHDPSTAIVRALSAYILRFQDFNGGLGSIERSLLGAGADEMKKSACIVGIAMAQGKPETDLIGDFILFERLVELCGATPDPWFRMEGDPRKMSGSSAQITESGKEARARYSVQPL